MTPEQKDLERDRLYKLYWQRDKEFETAKLKRTIFTIIGFAVFYFIVLYQIGKPSGFDILWALISALVIAGFHFYINSFIFLYLFNKGRQESDRLAAIKKQFEELE